MPLNAHKLVAKRAIALADDLFETFMHSNDWHAWLRAGGQVSEAHARNLFRDRVAPRYFEQARQELTTRLTEPDDVTPAAMKEEIAEALILDNEMRANRIVTDDRLKVPGWLQ